VSTDPLVSAVTPKTDWFIILRPFHGGDDDLLVRGEVVNTTEWLPHRKSTLVDMRYVAPLPAGADLPELNSQGKRILELNEEQEQQVPEKKRPASETDERPVPSAADRKERK
jgi:hypothetical protein